MDYGVECPRHSGVFDYRTGEPTHAPACINLPTYPVKVEDGQVCIEVSP
jgi:3-phenylpropionate/trans-cinnamate dioxygenase ferredoxin component